MAPFFLVLFPLIMVYGLLFPWQPAAEALSKYENSVALLSGIRSSHKDDYEKHSKTYLIIKTKPLSSFAVRVTVDSSGLNKVEEYEGGFIIMLATYLFLFFWTWWFWFKKKEDG
ncbi:MAG: hypothetical protein KAT25_02330 [Sulfuriflexus sp.]|nr:hypothetical protein [Sulfuriflexus sp.]